MKNIFIYIRRNHTTTRGFVLPFTLFICSIMILLTTSVATILIKQLYFSKLSRQSQAAYYAADNAVLCASIIDSTYTDENGIGIFPYNSASTSIESSDYMAATFIYIKDHRAAAGDIPLATTLDGASDGIKCAQSIIFDTNPLTSDFKISPTTFSRITSNGDIEDGKTSSFKMKMDMGDGTYRCAKVTINKTPSYRQIIAQGYALCDRPDGSVERAVVDTTITQ